MQARFISFGLIEIEGRRYDHDVVVDGGVVRKRGKKPSRQYRDQFGHTPLSVEEDIPWSGPRLVIGTGASGQMPVMEEVIEEAEQQGVEIVALPTREACQVLADTPNDQVFAILHVTC